MTQSVQNKVHLINHLITWSSKDKYGENDFFFFSCKLLRMILCRANVGLTYDYLLLNSQFNDYL